MPFVMHHVDTSCLYAWRYPFLNILPVVAGESSEGKGVAPDSPWTCNHQVIKVKGNHLHPLPALFKAQPL